MNPRLFFSGFLLILVTLACTVGPASTASGGETPGSGAVATQVALQLTAAAQGTTPPALADTITPAASQPSALAGSLKLVYSQAGNIRLWDGTESKQLTSSGQDSSPTISDDGAVVAFRRTGELWAVNSDGTGERVLVSTAALAALPHIGTDVPIEPYRFDFAPDSHTVYFTTAGVTDPSPLFELDLIKVDADSLALQPLLKNGQAGAEFTFSPDGSRIALAADNKISLVRADGNGLATVFTFPPVNMYNGSGYYPQVVWLPDSSGFETVIPAADALANPSAPTRFMFVPADGSRAAQLAEFISTPAYANHPRISPDGTRVLYARPQGANLELHIIDASTADRSFFSCATDKCGLLGWAPDSLHVVYWIADRRLAFLGAPDSQPFPLSDVTQADAVTWVDATRYLFLDGSDLRLRTFGQPSLLIDTADAAGFDFVPKPH